MKQNIQKNFPARKGQFFAQGECSNRGPSENKYSECITYNMRTAIDLLIVLRLQFSSLTE